MRDPGGGGSRGAQRRPTSVRSRTRSNPATGTTTRPRSGLEMRRIVTRAESSDRFARGLFRNGGPPRSCESWGTKRARAPRPRRARVTIACPRVESAPSVRRAPELLVTRAGSDRAPHRIRFIFPGTHRSPPTEPTMADAEMAPAAPTPAEPVTAGLNPLSAVPAPPSEPVTAGLDPLPPAASAEAPPPTPRRCGLPPSLYRQPSNAASSS